MEFILPFAFAFIGILCVVTAIQFFYIRYLVRRLNEKQEERELRQTLDDIFKRIKQERLARTPHNSAPIDLNTN
jgi:cell division protein FtsL